MAFSKRIEPVGFGLQSDATCNATVIAAFGRHVEIEADDGRIAKGHSRGKRWEICVGDRIVARFVSKTEAVIDHIGTRQNLLYRAQAGQEKRFAANLDAVWLVLAPEPSFPDEWLFRALAVCSAAELSCCLVLNKNDLTDGMTRLKARLENIVPGAYQRWFVSAGADPEVTQALLRPPLAGQRVLLLGPSGMGKSTLLNLLVPEAKAATATISTALDSGKHTTTYTRLYRLPAQANLLSGEVIDSPGFSAFGIQHLSQPEVESGFEEFEPFSPHCKFYNCSHRHEPGCAVRAAVSSGDILPGRYGGYCELMRDLLAKTLT